jgi:hypothetical protein
MNWLKKLSLRLLALVRKEKLDLEMAEEMRLHLELRTQANINAGMSPEEARRAARRRFGGVDQIQETCRDQRGVTWIEHLCQEIRYALRTLARARGLDPSAPCGKSRSDGSLAMRMKTAVVSAAALPLAGGCYCEGGENTGYASASTPFVFFVLLTCKSLGRRNRFLTTKTPRRQEFNP